jgi:hypothetical protein
MRALIIVNGANQNIHSGAQKSNFTNLKLIERGDITSSSFQNHNHNHKDPLDL